MKKFVAVLAVSVCFMLCSCYADTSGYTYELTKNSWYADFEGDKSAQLSFEQDEACFKFVSMNKTAVIKGDYIADDSTFVIFVPQLSQNYKFDYSVHGEKLDVTFNGAKITLCIAKK